MKKTKKISDLEAFDMLVDYEVEKMSKKQIKEKYRPGEQGTKIDRILFPEGTPPLAKGGVHKKHVRKRFYEAKKKGGNALRDLRQKLVQEEKKREAKSFTLPERLASSEGARGEWNHAIPLVAQSYGLRKNGSCGSGCYVPPPRQEYFDLMIGVLDRCLSEMLMYSKCDGLSEINKKTLKHHAEDMKGAAEKILERLNPPPDIRSYVSPDELSAREDADMIRKIDDAITQGGFRSLGDYLDHLERCERKDLHRTEAEREFGRSVLLKTRPGRLGELDTARAKKHGRKH